MASEIIGTEFGRLTVTATYKVEGRWWAESVCSCGGATKARLSHLQKGATRSCGCLRRELASFHMLKHGATHTREYETWQRMKDRCYNKNSPDYRLYGAKGIRVDDTWVNSFETFFADMGVRPDGLSIERRDSSADYCVSNCFWADAKTQANNTSRNVRITYEGVTRTLIQWAELLGMKRETIRYRHRQGWPLSDVLNPKIYQKR